MICLVYRSKISTIIVISRDDDDDTPERNLPLYRDALSKLPRLVYVRNLDGGKIYVRTSVG